LNALPRRRADLRSRQLSFPSLPPLLARVLALSFLKLKQLSHRSQQRRSLGSCISSSNSDFDGLLTLSELDCAELMKRVDTKRRAYITGYFPDVATTIFSYVGGESVFSTVRILLSPLCDQRKLLFDVPYYCRHTQASETRRDQLRRCHPLLRKAEGCHGAISPCPPFHPDKPARRLHCTLRSALFILSCQLKFFFYQNIHIINLKAF
jgi:hypothetical protein